MNAPLEAALKADGVTGNAAKEAASNDRHLLPRCFRCGHLLHAGECVNVAPHNAKVVGLDASAACSRIGV